MSLRGFVRGLIRRSDLLQATSGWQTRHWERFFRLISTYERELWVTAVTAMVVDLVLTGYGLRLGLRELNPVARGAIDIAGIAGLAILSALAVAMAYYCTLAVPERYTPLVPLGLALPSLFAVCMNTVAITIILL